MRERVKVFTHLTSIGAPVNGGPLEEAMNLWLEGTPGRLVRVRQSEGERPGLGYQLTMTVWYVPGDVRPDIEIPF